ncbi:CCA tRNA nucleotidyltransferase [Marinisporobacter balticus]|uniref:tRNA nucleotidyltransferase (CCA-adding enzyme) n=1 Tax=Marinisporobacter balticus TaxID=2018667 RepID=A0A4R2LKA5_9FIRM|nr:CCA tRNA nucleotidyltransferase [Marinisporobacter balticus]TCO79815.1 tRNA nucleotidyltransferase (CCA-adding enzyme) [Marinisporobacter balticus]
MKIQIPKKVHTVLDVLNFYKYEGYIVGGCVRDSILGRTPNDWDICTNCMPEKMLEIFYHFKVIPTGLKHGTVTVVVDDKSFEVTTYRIDQEYIDGRHPERVEFTNELKEDLKRRDFTVNAMAYGRKEGLIDYYGGMADIFNKKIRCVGDPMERFNEDYLRMLRGVRFSTQLGYELDIDTMQSIRKSSRNIVNISKERIREEINKILLSDKPSKGFKLLYETELLQYIIPELQECIKFEQRNPYHDKDVFDHVMSVLDHTEKDLVLRLAAMLHDIGKPQCFSVDESQIGHFYHHHMKGMDITEEILKRLKYDNKTIELVKILVKEHMCKYDKVTPRVVKGLINRIGLDNIERLFKLQIADIKGSKGPHAFDSIEKVIILYKKIISEQQPLSIKDLDINGMDLMKLGIPQGKKIGIILNCLLDKVLDDPELNTKELLIDEVKTM